MVARLFQGDVADSTELPCSSMGGDCQVVLPRTFLWLCVFQFPRRSAFESPFIERFALSSGEVPAFLSLVSDAAYQAKRPLLV